uniref:TNFR-Cys domain-containing protein n=1 Tax=Sander lucioperca TaxID=283035 RepID=A0A8D0ADE3_SANLU
MGASCHGGQYWDALLKKCIGCQIQCKQSHIIPKCTSYCESARCKALLGHYYDALLKICVKCSKICGSHPAECSQHCQITAHVPNSRGISGLIALEDSTILLYSLLALCTLLLFSSLSLALAVLLRRARAKTSKPGSKEANHNKESVCGMDTSQRDHEPSYDSIPTETCVCVHCFPDLKALGQGNDRPLRAPFSFYQQPVLHRGALTHQLDSKELIICCVPYRIFFLLTFSIFL